MAYGKSRGNIRTDKERKQKRIYDFFVDEFYAFYLGDLEMKQKDVLFAYNKKVKEKQVWAYIDFNERYGSIMVYLNFDLVEENKKLITLTAKRMALKVYFYKLGKPFNETNEDYMNMAHHFYLWNYGGFPETPQKHHIYKCTICGTPMAVFPDRLPLNNELTSTMKTPWHNKSMSSEVGGKPHQGGYAYAGNEEITNAELQKILTIMKESVEFTKNFTDNELKFIRHDNDYDY